MTSKTEEQEKIKIEKGLKDRLEEHDENRKAVLEKIHAGCEDLRKQIDGMEERLTSELEEKFEAEDSRLQNTLYNVQKSSTEDPDKHRETMEKAKAELSVKQSYDVKEQSLSEAGSNLSESLSKLYDLRVQTEVDEKWLVMRPPSVKVTDVSAGRINFEVTSTVSQDTERILKKSHLDSVITHKASLRKKGCKDPASDQEYDLKREGNSYSFSPDFQEPDAQYNLDVKALCKGSETKGTAEFTTPEFSECCVWKKCPNYVIEEKRKYSVDEKNPRVATK